MARRKNRQQQQKSNWIPPVGNGGIQKRHQSNQPLSIAVQGGIPLNDPSHLPGFSFAARLAPGPSSSCAPPHPSFPPPNYINRPFPNNSLPISAHLPQFLPPFPPFPPPPSAVPSFLPPSTVPSVLPPGLVTTPVLFSSNSTKNGPTKVTAHGNGKGTTGESGAKKAQLKYAKDLAAKTNKRASLLREVKTEPTEQRFNVFMKIAQRYRSVQKSPDPINILEDEEDDDDEVEEIAREQGENGTTSDITIIEDMSICTVDEVGEQTMAAVEEEEEEEEEEGGVEIVSEGEEEDDEIVCLGSQKTGHVLSVVTLGDDGEEEEEVDVMNKAFNQREERGLPMEDSIIDMSFEDDESEKEKVASGAELPDFIPLIDGKKDKGKQQQSSRSVQTVQQENGGTQSQSAPSSSIFPWKTTPMVVMARTKSVREKKREKYRKRAEDRAISLGSSPCTVARAVAISTCSFPRTLSPSKIPLPKAPAPSTPLAHRFSFPPGSAPSSSIMGLIHSRGISTSAPQSQPVNFADYGISHLPSSSSSLSGMDSASPTLAAVLHDETRGIVKDALTANGIYRRDWEEKWTQQAADSSSDIKVDPSAAPFRICTYNVLCQKTISATDYLYRHARFQPHVLQWAHRWPLIQKDLNELNADVFGLQEIQDVHFEQFYEPFMKSLGYVCLFLRKSETCHSDGLGIFVRGNRFKVTATKTVDFLIPGDNLLNRGNVAQILRLECLQTGASLLVTNTHILFNEKRGDVKLAQIALLMANIHAMREGDEPVLCLGDWNLEPESDLYNYITNGSLDASRFVPRYGSGQLREGRNFSVAPMREMPMDTHLKTRMSREGILHQNEGSLLQSLQRSSPSMFTHQIPLISTYAPYGERRVSTFHKDVANPDFIFYSTAGRGEGESRRLRLIRRLAVPPESNIRQQMEPWPNHYVPSDHIPLLAEFYLSK